MPDWERFRNAYSAGDPTWRRLQYVRQVESWLGLPEPARLAALIAACQAGGDGYARSIYEAMLISWPKLLRDAGIAPNAAGEAALRQLFAAAGESAATEEQRRLAAPLNALSQLLVTISQRYPSVVQPVTPAELARVALRESITALWPPLAAAQAYMRPETVSPARVAALEQALDGLRALASGVALDNPALPELYATMGHAAASLGRGCLLLGVHGPARSWLVQAATWFDQAMEPGHAAACRARAQDLDLQLAGDLDRTIEQQLRQMLSLDDQGHAASGDTLERVKALIGLAESTRRAGDLFEASRHGEAAAALLTGLGFRDPQTADTGADAAMDSWIVAAAGSATGTAFLDLVTLVSGAYTTILGLRVVASQATQPAVATRASALSQELAALTAASHRQVLAAEQAIAHDFAPYRPAASSGEGAPSGADAPDLDAAAAEAEAVRRNMQALDEACIRLCEQCESRLAAGQAVDDLIAAADGLRAPAALLGKLSEAKVERVRANLLFAARRPGDQLAAAEACLVALLDGRPPALSSLSQLHERTIYLEALTWKTKAQMMLQDYAALLATCEETVRDIESQRYRISSPYQQSAFLATVSCFYQWAALAAFKLGLWDRMLQAAELIKARSAVRSRLSPPEPTAPVAAVERELEHANAELAQALASKPAASPARITEIEEHRRRLWDLLAIARGHDQSQRTLSELTVAALQATLAPDEAAVGYFWLAAPYVLLVTAVDGTRFHAERVIFTEEAVGQLAEYVTALQSQRMSVDAPELAATRLGSLLLPEWCREILRGKKRLVLSPHQQLHLFPFQAIRWEGEFLGSRFAVRYVPNFSSMLLPWFDRCGDDVLAIGVSAFAIPGISPLRGAAAELAQVREIYASRGITVEVLADGAATWAGIERLRAAGPMARFRCVHLATHGLSVFAGGSLDQPMESRLYLQDRAIDGMDVAELRFTAELAVLSACNSGQRAVAGRGFDSVPGDDIFGLQWALFQSGVRAVIGSLWPLDDRSGAAIIASFHRHHAGGETAEVALQSAVREHLKAAGGLRQKPYFWASLFLSSLGTANQPRPDRSSAKES